MKRDGRKRKKKTSMGMETKSKQVEKNREKNTLAERILFPSKKERKEKERERVIIKESRHS